MIADDRELQTTLDRVAWFQKQVAQLRNTESNPVNYGAAISGFMAEIDRMQLEIREYLRHLPSDRVKSDDAVVSVTGDRSSMCS